MLFRIKDQATSDQMTFPLITYLSKFSWTINQQNETFSFQLQYLLGAIDLRIAGIKESDFHY